MATHRGSMLKRGKYKLLSLESPEQCKLSSLLAKRPAGRGLVFLPASLSSLWRAADAMGCKYIIRILHAGQRETKRRQRVDDVLFSLPEWIGQKSQHQVKKLGNCAYQAPRLRQQDGRSQIPQAQRPAQGSLYVPFQHRTKKITSLRPRCDVQKKRTASII